MKGRGRSEGSVLWKIPQISGFNGWSGKSSRIFDDLHYLVPCMEYILILYKSTVKLLIGVENVFFFLMQLKKVKKNSEIIQCLKETLGFSDIVQIQSSTFMYLSLEKQVNTGWYYCDYQMKQYKNMPKYSYIT